MSKYDLIYEELQEKVDSGELTMETAEYLNDVAYEMYADEEVEDDQYTEAMSNYAYQKNLEAQRQNNKRVSGKKKNVIATKMQGDHSGAAQASKKMAMSDDPAEAGAGSAVFDALLNADNTAVKRVKYDALKNGMTKKAAKAAAEKEKRMREAEGKVGTMRGEIDSLREKNSNLQNTLSNVLDSRKELNKEKARLSKELSDTIANKDKEINGYLKEIQRLNDENEKNKSNYAVAKRTAQSSQARSRERKNELISTKNELALANKRAKTNIGKGAAIGAAAVGGSILTYKGAKALVNAKKASKVKKEALKEISELTAKYNATKSLTEKRRIARQIEDLKLAANI